MLLGRFVHPAVDLPRPSTIVLEVRPGNAVLGLGDPFSVNVIARRGAPRTVSMRWREADTDWRELTLAPVTGEGDSTFHARLEAPRRSFEYYVRAGDFRSERFRVEICERPHPVRFDVEYRFPDCFS